GTAGAQACGPGAGAFEAMAAVEVEVIPGIGVEVMGARGRPDAAESASGRVGVQMRLQRRAPGALREPAVDEVARDGGIAAPRNLGPGSGGGRLRRAGCNECTGH